MSLLYMLGLHSSGRGVQYMIWVLSDLVERHADLLNLVPGGTHPAGHRHEGERCHTLRVDLIRSPTWPSMAGVP